MSKTILVAIVALLAAGQAVRARGTAAIIDESGPTPCLGEIWCAFLEDNGYECTVFPTTGPDGPLSDFDVVIDMSEEWSDPTGMLADQMRAHKGVIMWGPAPFYLGVDTEPTVQAWIGANEYYPAGDMLLTTAVDPILGGVPPGTLLGDCADSFCSGLADTSGHVKAKVLAQWERGWGPIGVMRNVWEGGQSVYFTDYISVSVPQHQEILLNTMEVLMNPIPTVSEWGMVIFALLVVSAGSLVIARRRAGWVRAHK